MICSNRLRVALLATSALAAAGLGIPAQAQDVPVQDEQTEAGEASAVVGEALLLDEITVVPSRTPETATQSMTSTSLVGEAELQRLQPATPSDVFFGMPGVTASNDGNPTSTNINIRGLQDAGRVAVVVDGARRNFQINGHRNGTPVWLEPEMLKSVSVVRGPVSNIYGSGAIGGLVAFETKEADDFLLPGEMAAGALKASYETNGDGMLGSATAAARLTPDIDVIGNLVYRERDDYEDGDGFTVPGTGFDVLGGMGKATIRPSEFSKITLGWLGDRQDWSESGGQLDTELEQDTFTGGYEYHDPAMPWLDLKASAYFNRTNLRQTRLVDDDLFLGYEPLPFPPGALQPVFATLPAGSSITYDIQTDGFDIHNTSRFDTGALRHTLTYGGDWFRDDVDTTDTAGVQDSFNPVGRRSAFGAFVQNRTEYADWFELLTALRYDGYRLDSPDAQTDGDRLSPRVTLGIKPLERTALHGLQVYGTYAEGYRAPSIGETLITGVHPSMFAPFSFLPNPDLSPETAKTVEIGVNVERDNVFVDGDGLRIKAAWFRNDVDDYIELTGQFAGAGPACQAVPGIVIPGGPPFPVPWTGFDCYRYENVSEARLQGFEFEGLYDMGRVFAGLRGQVMRGDNLDVHQPLLTVPADQVTALIGFRFLDGKLTVGGETQFVAAQDRLPPGTTPTGAHTLANLFASYAPSENFRLDLRIDNLFDEAYRDHLNPSLGVFKEPGFNARLAATVRFGADGPGIFAAR